MKTIAAKVLLVDRFENPKEWSLRIPTMPREKAADLIFHISNAPDNWQTESDKKILAEFPRTGLRSVSVGDVILIQDETRPEICHTCHVVGVGFKFHDITA